MLGRISAEDKTGLYYTIMMFPLNIVYNFTILTIMLPYIRYSFRSLVLIYLKPHFQLALSSKVEYYGDIKRML
jgi:hypothetical protein